MTTTALMPLLRAAAATLLLGVASAAAEGAPPPPAAGGTIAADTVWEGVVSVAGTVTVAPAATLTVRPGTEVRFAPGAVLAVGGRLFVEGSAERPVRFLPAAEGQPRWGGIRIGATGSPSLLRSCVIRGAESVALSGAAHRLEGCEVAGGVVGIAVTFKGSHPVISGCRVTDMEQAGITCSAGAAATVVDTVVERAGERGISASGGGEIEIRGCRISSCATGIELSQSPPRVSGTTVTGCVRGIALTSLGGGEPLRGNTVEGNETGILCQHFADPEISGNLIRRNREGIVCFMGAKPLISGNEIRDNETGVLCNQLATPEVTANVIAGNRRGVHLHLSSYAIIRGNDLTGNAVQVELGNMSLDWERRVGAGKPMRGLQQQRQGRAERGLPPLPLPGDGLEVRSSSVDASGNWWGEEVTREMATKGPDANIDSIVDGYDVPMRTYEGFEGEYAQDRVTYAPWAPGPVATGAGLERAAPPSGGAPPP